MNRSIVDKISVAASLLPAVYSASGDGEGVDLRGANSAHIEITTGTNTGSFTGSVVIQESDDNSTFTDAASADVIGTFDASVADTAGKIAYIGSKRYIRARIVKTGGTSIAASAPVVKCYLSQAPDDASYAS